MEPSGGIGQPACSGNGCPPITSMLENVPAHFVNGTVIALIVLISIIIAFGLITWRLRNELH